MKKLYFAEYFKLFLAIFQVVFFKVFFFNKIKICLDYLRILNRETKVVMKIWKLLNFCILNLCSRFKKMHQFLAHHSKFKSDTNPTYQSVICYKNDSSTNNIHSLSTVLPTMKSVLTTMKNCSTYNEIGFNYCEKLFYLQ